jgi:PAS domain S-box-containing protein
MKDEHKTKKQLVTELTELRQWLAEANRRVAELETSTAEHTRAEERNRALYEFSPDGVVTVGLDGRIVECNQAYAEMLGYDYKELEGLPCKDTMPHRWHDFCDKIHQEVMKRGYSYEFEKECIRKDGTVFPVSMRMWRIDDESGSPIGVWAITRDITERKRVEEELRRYSEKLEGLIEDKTRTLRESGESFRSLAENANDGILIAITAEGSLVYANKRAAEIMGYSVDELLKTRIKDLTHSDEFKTIMGRYRKRLAREDVSRQYETIFIRKDGKSVPIELTAARTAWHGQPAVIIIFRDITERKRAEEALRESEERFRSIFELSPYSTVLLDLEGNIQACNQQFTRFHATNEGAEAQVGRNVSEFFPPEEQPTLFAAIERTIKEPKTMVGPDEYTMLREDGSRFPAEGFSIAMVDEAGRSKAVLGLAYDITERKRAEEALRESEERYRAIFEQAADSIVLIDVETGALVEFNDKAHENLGYTREEFEKLKVSDFEITESTKQVAKHLETIIKEGADTFETKQRTKSGEIRDILVSARSISVYGRDFIQGIWRDITEYKRLEEQVRQQERLAAVGQLAGGIAHDFNNFLTTIMLYAQILLRKPSLPPELAPTVEIILEESRRAAQLVRRVLDFGRRSIMETRLVDLASFIEETADILRRTLPENIKLLTDAGSGEYVVNADLTRIQQVVMNLALNARDAMPKGGELRTGLSRVEVRPGDEPPVAEMGCGDWICLAVSDTGTGMTEEVQAHLFEPFFTTKGPKGTGLGLAQVYGIVKQHGGSIGVETQVGRGTTFRVYLPAQETAEPGAGSQATSVPPPGNNESILLVEDEDKMREAGREILESLGYRVLTAANGQEALQVYQSAEQVDLILTDMVMPEMGGKDLAQELKKIAPHVKVLAITGYTLVEDVEELREGGILDVVHKPFEVNALAEAIRQALDAG